MDTLTIYGIHPILSLLKKTPDRILEIYVLETRQDHRLQEIIDLAKKQGLALHFISKKQADHWQKEQHQGVMAKIRGKLRMFEEDLIALIQESQTPPLILVLDGVQDPHNLGACLRTADAAAATAVVIPKDRAVGLTPLVYKVASGAAESMPFIEVTNLSRTLQQLKDAGVWVMGLTERGKSTIFETDLRVPLALVLGAEGSGLRRLTETQCDLLLNIPMCGVVESLNVSVAAGVCLYEALRQRSL